MARQADYVAAFVRGEETAFKRLYEDTAGMLYRLILRMTGTRETAEYILHDVYIRAYTRRHLYDPGLSSLRTWLYRIAVNHTLNQLKRSRWLSGNLGRLFRGVEPDVLDSYLDVEEGRRALCLLQRVPENFRVCLVLRDIEGRPYEEISSVLRLNPGTVKSRLNRGRRILKALYAKEVSKHAK
jgi:RNA polymerase sigma-70 factor (ECF subfamily)